jgi:hypothetical protein
MEADKRMRGQRMEADKRMMGQRMETDEGRVHPFIRWAGGHPLLGC